MINSLLQGLFNFVVDSLSLITGPITAFITQYIPALSSGLSAVNSLIQWLIKFVIYISSWFNFNDVFWSFIVACFTFRLMVPLLSHTLKLLLRWYRMLMP